ncbi:hypothetical protein LCGC14_1527930 [marine sediment metagenome]|uniref:Uncharacterized protein n=1 Tax=marine sediment metagenome TaxID=412755 RepID=A0A0F9LXP5_9ZZZZ
MRLSRTKRGQRQERIEQLRKLFDAQVLEFSEDNMPTQIVTFMEDMLAALPESARECNVEGLFETAVVEWR